MMMSLSESMSEGEQGLSEGTHWLRDHREFDAEVINH
jgi:hypothetical protein